MSKLIRIGTRDSQLALWQARFVKNIIEHAGYQTEVVPLTSDGDQNLEQPLYEMGITGIFTKTLDVALINNKIDVAVHSMKDVPTQLPNNISQGAVLHRAATTDILVHKGIDFLEREGTIATGSLRRKAQWLNKYPKHKVVDLRGNVNTRLQKLEDNDWNGAIFASAGLERIDKKPDNHIVLDWMVPAPAQGAIMVAHRSDDLESQEALSKINHRITEVCTHVERQFLSVLEGGCTAPIGALATNNGDKLNFVGELISLDGKRKVSIEKQFPFALAKDAGRICAMKILEDGGAELMEEIKAAIKS
ncbi:hydroxymethylbilane synthase [Spongiivirga sp. MCCC 1A20706]|uniref:hydroxymethylbilane synthase n=1 Tax=Spongiivirga sp. MCCC 1A20706 TaxID=3160963 RepID=UPI003977A0FE